MSYNYQQAKNVFEREWIAFEKMCIEAGMNRNAIDEMRIFDERVLKRDRAFYKRNISMEMCMEICPIEVEKKMSYEQDIFEDMKDGWIESLENEKLTRVIKAMTREKRSLIEERVIQGKRYRNIAAERGLKESTMRQQLVRIKKHKKF